MIVTRSRASITWMVVIPNGVLFVVGSGCVAIVRGTIRILQNGQVFGQAMPSRDFWILTLTSFTCLDTLAFSLSRKAKTRRRIMRKVRENSRQQANHKIVKAQLRELAKTLGENIHSLGVILNASFWFNNRGD